MFVSISFVVLTSVQIWCIVFFTLVSMSFSNVFMLFLSIDFWHLFSFHVIGRSMFLIDLQLARSCGIEIHFYKLQTNY